MMITKINRKETELGVAKAELIQLKNKLDIAQSDIQLKSKEFWSDLGITNAEGRRAYIHKQTGSLRSEVCDKQAEIVVLESELRCFEREFECFIINKKNINNIKP